MPISIIFLEILHDLGYQNYKYYRISSIGMIVEPKLSDFQVCRPREIGFAFHRAADNDIILKIHFAWVAELVDARDLKSLGP